MFVDFHEAGYIYYITIMSVFTDIIIFSLKICSGENSLN